jgi:Lrp/AsnC family transcriptional regulator, regulator for asnA, asnC and gidA
MKRFELDEIDKSILNILMNDANISYVDIAKKIKVSTGTVHVRMKNLIAADIVKKAFLNVDYNRLGLNITAFIGVHLIKSSLYSEVIQELYKIPELVSAHLTTANFSIFVKIICRDSDHLHEILYEKIQRIEGVERTETFISLEEPIYRPIQIF